MVNRDKLNNFLTGFISGLVLPVIVFIIVWQFTGGYLTLGGFIRRMIAGDVVTHFISMSVFPNIFIFLLFNRLDMLKCSRGVLGITILWALLTFVIKFAF